MIRSKKRLPACMMTSLCLLWISCLPTIAATKPANVQRVKGGYLLNDAAMRDVVAGWQSDHAAVTVLRQGLDQLQQEIKLQAEDTKQLVADLRRELAAERAEYNRRIRRGRAQGLLIGLIIGAAGVAIVK